MASMLSIFVITTICHPAFAIQCLKSANCICSAGEPCVLNCIGTDWCKGGHNLRCAIGYPCILICSGEQACTDSKFIPNNATSINITCSGDKACSGDAFFKCQPHKPCAITCDSSPDACSTLDLDINSASEFMCDGPNCLNLFPPPFAAPTNSPTFNPTKTPTNSPTFSTSQPTNSPTPSPTDIPSHNPTIPPTNNPTALPTAIPSRHPTELPTSNPTPSPTINPTPAPSNLPTSPPSNSASITPTLSPSVVPTSFPTRSPTYEGETTAPTNNPTTSPVTDGQVADISTTSIDITQRIEIASASENSALNIIIIIMIICSVFAALLTIIGLIVLKLKQTQKQNRSNISVNKNNANHHISPVIDYEDDSYDIEVVNRSKAQHEFIKNTKGGDDDERYLSEAQKHQKIQTKRGLVDSGNVSISSIRYDNGLRMDDQKGKDFNIVYDKGISESSQITNIENRDGNYLSQHEIKTKEGFVNNENVLIEHDNDDTNECDTDIDLNMVNHITIR